MYKKLEEFQKSKLWNGFYAANGYFISFCGIALTCVIFAAVVMRYCFKLDFFGSEEIILLFAWWMYFLGGIGGSQEDSQIKADMVEVFAPTDSSLTWSKVLPRLSRASCSSSAPIWRF